MPIKLLLYATTLLVFASPLKSAFQAQSGHNESSFVRDANRPFVYLAFDHIGKGVQRNQDEPSIRIWLRFVNNCNVPIVLHASGGLKGMLAGEVNVWDRVVPDPPILRISVTEPTPEPEHSTSTIMEKAPQSVNSSRTSAHVNNRV